MMKNQSQATIKKDGYEICYGFRIRLLEAKAKKRYQVDLGRKSGKHVRKSFDKLQEARNWARLKSIEADNKGIHALKFSDDQKTDAVEALELLKEFGVNLRTAAAYYTKHHKKVDRTNGLAPLITQYLAEQKKRKDRGDLRERTYTDMKNRLHPFSEDLGHLAIEAVEADDIDSLMDERGFQGTNRQNYKRYLSGFFSWAIQKKKCATNPALFTRKEKIEQHTPEIYTPSEVKKIMFYAEEQHPCFIPYLALVFFAGIRPDEIKRLNWENIDLSLGEIHVNAGQSKTRSARIVHISKNLKAWLLKHRSPDGLLFPYSASTLKRWRKDVYEAANARSIQDGARHSFATFHLALHGSIDDTMQELGHSDSRVLFKHYRGLAKNRKAQAKKFFGIAPDSKQKVIEYRQTKTG